VQFAVGPLWIIVCAEVQIFQALIF